MFNTNNTFENDIPPGGEKSATDDQYCPHNLGHVLVPTQEYTRKTILEYEVEDEHYACDKAVGNWSEQL